MSPYMSHNQDNAVYDLFAVVNHYGNILAGHYTAYALSLDEDENVEVGKR